MNKKISFKFLVQLLLCLAFVAVIVDTRSAEDMDYEQEITRLIGTHDVVVFSKSDCPYCTKAKNLLKEKYIPFHEVNFSNVDNPKAYRERLKKFSGLSTVPNIYIKGEHVGGSDMLQQWNQDGKLDGLSKRK